MIELTRTVRFCLNGPDSQATNRSAGNNTGVLARPIRNAYSATPPMRGLGRYYQVSVHCSGEADPITGYFLNIKRIDQAVAHTILPYLQRLMTVTESTAELPMGRLMRSMIQLLQDPLDDSVVELSLELTPTYTLTIRSNLMSSVIVRQHYEFAAAHRLHTPKLSDQENRDLFGKCNNPSGHGHNYKVSVAILTPIDNDGRITPVEKLDALIDKTVIQPLDHQHLNVDVPQFAQLNPTVENITTVIYDLIKEPVEQLGMQLHEVSVWETDRTVCTYRGA